MGSTFCLVPARSGSTRIPDKNLAVVGGRSLLERAVATGLEAFGEVFVSTDDEAYAETARRAGATVPALRPGHLATAESPVELAAVHAVTSWGSGQDVVALLQPTSPFTTPEQCRGVVDALRARPDAGSAVTVVEAPATTAFTLRQESDGLATFLVPDLAHTRTQDLPALCVPSGGVFAVRTEALLAGATFVTTPVVPVLVPASHAVDIDEQDDLDRARGLA